MSSGIRMSTEIRKAAKAAVEQGWDLEEMTGNRIKWTPPDKTQEIVITSAQPQAGSSAKNAIQNLRASGLVLPNDANPKPKEEDVKTATKALPTYREVLEDPTALKGLSLAEAKKVAQNADPNSIEYKIGVVVGGLSESFQIATEQLASNLMKMLKDIGLDDTLETQALEAMEELDTIRKRMVKLEGDLSRVGSELQAERQARVTAEERAVTAENKLRVMREALA